jgi:SpoVK/Ycf46/Vps4 family AAA+-type ATPase
MEKNNNINWDDIAGLEFAKKTINEILEMNQIMEVDK